MDGLYKIYYTAKLGRGEIKSWSPRRDSGYNRVVEITFDPQKHERNLRERNLGFDEAAQFDFLSASYFGEVRNGESRVVGIGYLGKRLHVLCFIPTHNGIRVISFRKANDREARKYGKPKTIDE
jgi:uncharacterized DUF497 family protein